MHIYEQKLIECLGLTYVVARNLILHCYWNIRFFYIYLFYAFFVEVGWLLVVVARIESMKS